VIISQLSFDNFLATSKLFFKMLQEKKSRITSSALIYHLHLSAIEFLASRWV